MAIYASSIFGVDCMKMFKIIGLAVLFLPSIASADSVSDARELFSQWQPEKITLAPGGVLRVVLPQRQITDTIFDATIRVGLCFGPLLGQSMNDVKSVFILNSNETQGWLFEAGASACEQINHTPANQAKVLVAGQSSVHTDTTSGL